MTNLTSKQNNFRRIATKRTNEIISKISSLVNFRNKQYYEFSNEDFELIFKAIEDELHRTKDIVLSNSKRFSLDTKKTDE